MYEGHDEASLRKSWELGVGYRARSTEADLPSARTAIHPVAWSGVRAARQIVELIADDTGSPAQARALAGRSHPHAELMGMASAIEPDGETRACAFWDTVEQAS